MHKFQGAVLAKRATCCPVLPLQCLGNRGSCTMLVTMNHAASIVESMFMLWMKMMGCIPSARIALRILSGNGSDNGLLTQIIIFELVVYVELISNSQSLA